VHFGKVKMLILMSSSTIAFSLSLINVLGNSERQEEEGL
jgi:hypothetical protein